MSLKHSPEMYEVFLQFLDKHGAKEAYLRNTRSKRIPSGRSVRNYLICAFSWVDSPERLFYWNSLHRKWDSVLRQAGAIV